MSIEASFPQTYRYANHNDDLPVLATEAVEKANAISDASPNCKNVQRARNLFILVNAVH